MDENIRNAKGEGSFIVNENGSITHRKSVGYKANGRRKVLTVTATTKSACIREMRKKEECWRKKEEQSSVFYGSTVIDLCLFHLNSQIEGKELKPKSIDRRECTIEQHIGKYDLGCMQVSAVSPTDIDNHINTLMQKGKLSVSSIIKVVDVLNAAYGWAIRRGDLERNPVLAIKPELQRKIKRMESKTACDADVIVLTEEEAKRFEQEATSHTANGKLKYSGGYYGLLLLYTGMRCGEMIALRWRDIDFENGLLTIEKSCSVAKNRNRSNENDKKYILVEGSTKNEKARVIELMPEAKKILQLIRVNAANDSPDALVAPTKSGKANTATNLEHRMAIIFRNAGIEGVGGSLHIFRRTFATRMYQNGARTKEIAAYIGDLESTTERYYIAIRTKINNGGKIQQVVKLPSSKEGFT